MHVHTEFFKYTSPNACSIYISLYFFLSFSLSLFLSPLLSHGLALKQCSIIHGLHFSFTKEKKQLARVDRKVRLTPSQLREAIGRKRETYGDIEVRVKLPLKVPGNTVQEA